MPWIPGISFVVTQVNGCAHVVLKDTTEGTASVEQSMTFRRQEEFDDWCRNEKRRMEFPHVYEELIRSVSRIFKA